jgi:predicted Zn-dependent protease
MEKQAHAEASPLLEAALKIEPEHCFVLHALAVCRLATNEPEQAHAPLRTLLERDPRWASYLAWRTLIDVHLARRQPADALDACRELARRQPTLENKCLLAEHLLDNDWPTEAAELLDEALEEHQYAPWSARWRNGSWARKARQLLVEADASEKKKVDQM